LIENTWVIAIDSSRRDLCNEHIINYLQHHTKSEWCVFLCYNINGCTWKHDESKYGLFKISNF